MPLKLKTIPLLLTGSLVVSACDQVPFGDFCDIAEPIRFERDIAETVVIENRDTAERIDAHNRYLEQHCGW